MTSFGSPNGPKTSSFTVSVDCLHKKDIIITMLNMYQTPKTVVSRKVVETYGLGLLYLLSHHHLLFVNKCPVATDN